MERLSKAQRLSKVRLSAQYLRAGDKSNAEPLAREAWLSAPKEVLPLAHLVDTLYQCGKWKEAAERFGQLRSISAAIDLDAPVFRRLEPLARELKLPIDWRVPTDSSSVVIGLPELASLGPFRWCPPPAPRWSLTDANGRTVALEDFRGRPVVVIFSLGYGCLHCAEQVRRFAGKATPFADAGISLVAISSDSPPDLKKSVQQLQPAGAIPFPIAADFKLEAFKSYRAYDDFEGRPMHGTFLIDGQGRLRWLDIGFEPFNDVDFVLKESTRLLRIPDYE